MVGFVTLHRIRGGDERLMQLLQKKEEIKRDVLNSRTRSTFSMGGNGCCGCKLGSANGSQTRSESGFRALIEILKLLLWCDSV